MCVPADGSFVGRKMVASEVYSTRMCMCIGTVLLWIYINHPPCQKWITKTTYPLLFCASLCLAPESIEWFIEDQGFSPSYDLAPPPPSPPSLPRPATHRKTEKERQLADGGGGIYKSFNTLWCEQTSIFQSWKCMGEFPKLQPSPPPPPPFNQLLEFPFSPKSSPRILMSWKRSLEWECSYTVHCVYLCKEIFKNGRNLTVATNYLSIKLCAGLKQFKCHIQILL